MVYKECSYNGSNNIGRFENACPIYLTRDMNSCKNMLNIVKHMFNNDMKRSNKITHQTNNIKPIIVDTSIRKLEKNPHLYVVI